MAVGPWLVEMIFGGRYGPAGQLLGPALRLLVPLTAGTATSQVLVARGRFVPPALCALAGALVLTLALPGLAPAMGPNGALLAAGAGMCVWALSLIALLARSGGLDLGRGVLRPGVVVLVALGVYMGLEPAGVWLALSASWLVLLGGTLAIGVLAPVSGLSAPAAPRRSSPGPSSTALWIQPAIEAGPERTPRRQCRYGSLRRSLSFSWASSIRRIFSSVISMSWRLKLIRSATRPMRKVTKPITTSAPPRRVLPRRPQPVNPGWAGPGNTRARWPSP